MSVQNLCKQWVFITGAASGIGFETALAFAQAGANVILTDVGAHGLDVAREVIESCGVCCDAMVLDVSDRDAVRQVAQTVLARHGIPAVVINNAGIGFLGPFLYTSPEVWSRVFDVNLMGIVHVCQAFLPMMLQSPNPSHIVNIASVAGLHPAPNLSAYGASKHAVMGLHDALVMELMDTAIGLTVVCPGIINTPIVRNRQAVSDVVPAAQVDKISSYYQRNGAPPSAVAARIVQAVRKGEGFVLVGPTATALHHIKRLSRTLANWAMLRGCRKNGYAWR